MKTYPTMSGDIVSSQPIYAFDKLDGSNIRAEWSARKGFYKFGTRKRLLDKDEPILGPAVDLVLNKYADDLAAIFKKQRQRKAICFFEFYGPNSFAGFHDKDEQQTVTLFDVNFQKGILEPREFLKFFGHLEIPRLLFQGKVGQAFVNEVNEGRLQGMTFEGVVCKGKNVSPGLPLMFKIKNHKWYAKLRAKRDLVEAPVDNRLLKIREAIKRVNEDVDISNLLEEFDGWFPEVKDEF